MHARLWALLLALLPTFAAAQSDDATATGDFIRLVGGSEIHGAVEIIRPVGETPYLRIEGQERYTLDRVYAFETGGVRFDSYARAIQKGGIPTVERFFLERTVAGPLNLYTRVDWNRPRPNDASFDFFAVGGGPVQSATTANLRAVLDSDPASLQHMRRSDTWGRVQYGLLAVGSTLLLYGIQKSVFNTEPVDPSDPTALPGEVRPSFKLNVFYPLGAGMSALGLLSRQKKFQARRAAISAYGRAEAPR